MIFSPYTLPNSAIILPTYACPLYKEQTGFRLNTTEWNAVRKLSYRYEEKPALRAQISKDPFLFKKKVFKRIKKFIEERAQIYKQDVLELTSDTYLTQSWVAKSPAGAAHFKHAHPNTLFSMVYYAQCEDKDATLQFSGPLNCLSRGFNFTYNTGRFNFFNSDAYTLRVKTGTVLAFPGWLSHSANIQTSEKFIIGANFFIKGKLGAPDRVDYIEI